MKLTAKLAYNFGEVLFYCHVSEKIIQGYISCLKVILVKVLTLLTLITGRKLIWEYAEHLQYVEFMLLSRG